MFICVRQESDDDDVSDGEESDDEEESEEEDEEELSEEDVSSGDASKEASGETVKQTEQEPQDTKKAKTVDSSNDNVTLRVAAESTSEPDVSTTIPSNRPTSPSGQFTASIGGVVEKDGADSSVNLESQSESKGKEQSKANEGTSESTEKKAKKPRKRKAKPKTGEDGQPEKAKKKTSKLF